MTNRAGRTSSPLKRRIAGMGAGLIAFNLLTWAWALIAFQNHPLLLGTALLAYGFGLRHAVDADHIAAIDNVTRKLMADGQRPVATGLYFSLGHSTVVAALSLAVALAAQALTGPLAGLKATGDLIGTGVSAFFLLAIAIVNMVIWMGTWRDFRAARAGRPPAAEAVTGGGLMTWLYRRLFRLMGRSWHMYWLGLLFGLGFETASEIGLLGISASGAGGGLSPWAILVFPVLFSAGMALVDSADGMLMLGAYGWAFVKPMRKLYYNLTITALSVLVALGIGGLETLALIDRHLRPRGAFWHLVERVNGHFGLLGYGIVALFVLGWGASLAIYKLKRYDAIEMAQG